MHDVSIFRFKHKQRFGAEPAVFVAPGRVNLIGEHTDYAEGFVMPAAIDFATLAAISPRSDGKIALYSENYGEERHFDASAVPTMKASKHWTDYPLGVVSILAGEGHAIPAFSLSLWGDVPLGSGLSSSAALEVATALAVLSVLNATYPRPQLARLCQRAENEFVGSSCGIMDQFISANGSKDHAMLLDCRDLSFRLAPIPPDIALVIANTMVKHSVTGGDYTTRRAEVEAACAVIASHRPGVQFLRDATAVSYTHLDVYKRQPLERGGEFAKGLAMGRKAALELDKRLRRDARFQSMAGGRPELDIVVWKMCADDPGLASELAQKTFLACSARDLHLALVQLPLKWFAPSTLLEKALGSSEDEGGSVRCLRSVLMKPEHEKWLDEIWGRLTAASSETTGA